MTTKPTLSLCLPILRAAGLAIALSATMGWPFIPTSPSSSSGEVMGKDQTILALFMPQHPGT